MNSVERVKKICKDRKIPISKLEKDLRYSNGYIGQLRKGVFPDNRLIEIADYLGVSATYLMTGEEFENKEWNPTLTEKDERDIQKKLSETLNQLDNESGLMFDGEALDDRTRELLKDSLEFAIRNAKMLTKEKYTPKKYKK